MKLLISVSINYVIDSNNEPILNVKKFKNWFKNSKVLDAKNRPLVVYHGGSDGIKEFSELKIGRRDSGYYGYGFYFTPDKSSATVYAGGLRDYIPAGKTIYPVFIALQNPIVMKFGERVKTTMMETPKKWTDEQIKNGYDGTIVYDGDKIIEVVVFYKFPNLIKSVLNQEFSNQDLIEG